MSGTGNYELTDGNAAPESKISMAQPPNTAAPASGLSDSNAGLGMSLYSVQITYDVYVLAKSCECAEKFVEGLCVDAEIEMPGNDYFRFNASRTHNQADSLKAKALNIGMADESSPNGTEFRG